MTNEEKLEPFKNLIGRKIMIRSLDGEKDCKHVGKVGVVERVSIDPWGDVRLDGTWASIGIYPKVDEYILLKEDL